VQVVRKRELWAGRKRTKGKTVVSAGAATCSSWEEREAAANQIASVAALTTNVMP
jgi:hypothetical protein